MRNAAALAGAAMSSLVSILAPGAAQARPRVEVAFVLDTTGSMSGLIDAAKRKIWSIATAIVDANPDAEIRMGLVAYRDIGDEYVTRAFDLTTDIQDLYGNLLQLKAKGGGDWPESVNEALDRAVGGLKWTQDPLTDRIIFLVGDAPPHMGYQQDRKYPEIVGDARARGIIVNAVQAGGARDTERVWRSIAQKGGGRYIPIPQDGGQVVIIETPYDDEIIILQKKINATVIPYGDERRRGAVREKSAQIAAAPRSAASDMAGYLNRAGKGADAVTGEGDLVADVAQGRRRLDSIPEKELPETMRSLSGAERSRQIEVMNAQRQELARQMGDLVARRDAFVRDKSSAAIAAGGKRDSFDQAVEETLRAQVRR
ncbi:MAG: vWA domain-containing protein [Beijerinckiaceae bacterium]